MRFEAVTECEHGYDTEHEVVRTKRLVRLSENWTCSGGSRRVASTTDLIEELIARGATVEVRREWEKGGPSATTKTRYLVFSLEGEK